jgi:hypothetical protein
MQNGQARCEEWQGSGPDECAGTMGFGGGTGGVLGDPCRRGCEYDGSARQGSGSWSFVPCTNLEGLAGFQAEPGLDGGCVVDI